MIDRHRTAFAERDRITDRFTVFHDRDHSRHIVVALQGLDNLLQRNDIGIQLAAQFLQRCQPRPHIFVFVPHGHFVILRTGNQRQQAQNHACYYLSHSILRLKIDTCPHDETAVPDILVADHLAVVPVHRIGFVDVYQADLVSDPDPEPTERNIGSARKAHVVTRKPAFSPKTGISSAPTLRFPPTPTA